MSFYSAAATRPLCLLDSLRTILKLTWPSWHLWSFSCGTKVGHRFMCACYIPHSRPSQFFLRQFMDALQSSTRAQPPIGVGHLIYTFNQVGVTSIKNPSQYSKQSQVQTPAEKPHTRLWPDGQSAV